MQKFRGILNIFVVIYMKMKKLIRVNVFFSFFFFSENLYEVMKKRDSEDESF